MARNLGPVKTTVDDGIQHSVQRIIFAPGEARMAEFSFSVEPDEVLQVTRNLRAGGVVL